MRVIVGGERSGIVREAFRRLGHDAWSCDLAPCEDGSPFHIQGDYLWFSENIEPFDMGIYHPDCTYLCSSGLHWNKRRPEREALTRAAVDHVTLIASLPIDMVCIENPIGRLGTAIDWSHGWSKQIIQPYMFGDDASKATVLFHRGLPPIEIPHEENWIVPRIVEWPEGSGKKCHRWANQTDSGQNRLGPSATRWMDRARTYPGIAGAMAKYWGAVDFRT